MVKNYTSIRITHLLCLMLLLIYMPAFTGCDSSVNIGIEAKAKIPYDPTKPVTVDSFSPTTAGVMTQMIIYGSNFGTDVSLIAVTVEDKPVNVISSTGSQIYVMIPLDLPSGQICVTVGKDEQVQKTVTTEEFKYIQQPYVSTLAGFTDKDGQTAIVDGAINKAQFVDPYWLIFDKDKNLFILEDLLALRSIDKDMTKVQTHFRTPGGDFNRPRTLSFTPDGSSLYITYTIGNDLATTYAIQSASAKDNYTKISPLIAGSGRCQGGDIHPTDGTFFFSNFKNGTVIKWDPDTKVNKVLFNIQDTNWEFNIQFHPSGDYAYIVVINRHYILKAEYNYAKKELELPYLFAGLPAGVDNGSHKDGVGTSARFNSPHQGTFDEDNNFYICDRLNHRIRKITPNGIVSTFAGSDPKPSRPSFGYSDGPLRDSQFDRPSGIVYDKDKKVFYIADMKNRRIRKITMPN